MAESSRNAVVDNATKDSYFLMHIAPTGRKEQEDENRPLSWEVEREERGREKGGREEAKETGARAEIKEKGGEREGKG